MSLIIRPIKRAEINELINLCELHAAYEKATYDRTGKSELIEAQLFKESPSAFCIVAEMGPQLAGYATFMKQFSTWDASYYIYMDCLFLKEEFRGNRIGEKLIDQIKNDAKNLGCSLIQWQSPDFNHRAIKFYHRIGATSKAKERFFLEV